MTQFFFPKISFFSSSIEETYAIAHQLVKSLGSRGILSLEGPLGAGKTHFVKGAAIALGLEDAVTSPTFTLLQSYGTKNARLHHFDFYRLNHEAEVYDLGLDDYFSEGLTIIEWGNKFLSLLPKETIRITIRPLENEIREISWLSVDPLFNRIVSKLAAGDEGQGAPTRRPAVYKEVLEDASTGATLSFASAVEFRKKSNNPL